MYIDAIMSSSNTPKEFFILLSIKLAGNILQISNLSKKILENQGKYCKKSIYILCNFVNIVNYGN